MRKLIAVAAVLLTAGAASAGEWHSGVTNVCSDCHTAHYSMQHKWDGTAMGAAGVVAQSGNWLGASGPNEFLLKAPVNELCLACHNGTTFAPDVLGADTTGATYTQGRSAGALNDATVGAPYETYKGHTLGSTTPPPGYPAGATFYDATQGLECISCHAQHGSSTAYRNLGPFSIPGVNRPTYVISTTNDTTKDVWINTAAGYVANQGAANFTPYYDSANTSFNRNDAQTLSFTGGPTRTTSNKMDAFCGTCHSDFHGGAGAGDTTTAGAATTAALDGFIRHPTSGVTIGAAAAQSYGGHSALSQFVAGTKKVKVYASDRTAWTDAAPGCITCHKGHGNQNPFGLIFMARNSTNAITEQGTGAPTTSNGYHNLCGQCHSQASISAAE